MHILIDINHPGQVHLFKHAAWQWEAHGHQVLMVARGKDVTMALLQAYELRYVTGTTRQPGLVNLALELLRKTALVVKISRRFKPDVFLSVGSPAAAWASTLMRVPHIVFEDTEHSVEQYILYAPFTDVICTPSCFTKDLGRKQRRYNGYHELAYLHPNWFTPKPKVLHEIGLTEKDAYFIVRFVSWGATHDVGCHGFSDSGKRRLITELEKLGRVIITSETPLPPDFQPYQMSISPTKIHDLLAYSSLYIGEGATMASEAALLGIPSIYVNPLTAGSLEEEERYGLLYRIPDENEAIKRAIALMNTAGVRADWQRKRQRLLQDKIDVTAWMVDFVEGYVLRTRRLA